MSPSQPVDDLLAGPPPTHLPDDFPQVREGLETGDDPARLAAAHPAASLAWAALAEDTLDVGTDGAPATGGESGDARGVGSGQVSTARAVTAYAYARTGYHRGLDALRRAGWRGRGPIPADHVPNQGFLRALLALATAADLIGETEEAERCRQLLADSGTSAEAVRALVG